MVFLVKCSDMHMAKFLPKIGKYSGNHRLDARAMNLKEPDLEHEYSRYMWLEEGEIQKDPDFQEEIKKKIEAWKAAIKITVDPSKIIVHTVGESHIDCAWLWRYEQTRQKAALTFKKAIYHAKQFPNQFNFALSEPLLLEWVKKDAPELFKEIQDTVKKGGIELVGGSYVEPDCMMPSGEAFCRMRLYGMRFLKENFGILPEVEWFLDSFGYNWGIPQILAKSGAKYFWTSKITWNLDTLFPFVNFWWEGPDGSRILTANFQMGPGPLDNWYKFEIGRHPLKEDGRKIWDYRIDYDEIDEHIEEDEICPHVGNFFGKGDGGHGPTHQEVAFANEYCKDPMFKWSKVHDFYRELEKWSDRFPVWRDELYLENHRGTFSVHAEVKRYNRKNETTITSLESLALATALINDEYQYPFDDFEWAWKTTLKNQFHDTLPGSSIPEVYDDTTDDWAAQEKKYYEINRNIGDILSSKSKNAQEKETENRTNNESENKTKEEKKVAYIYLYNPMPWERQSRVFISVEEYNRFNNDIYDETSKPPYAKLISIDEKEEYICQPIAADDNNTIDPKPAGWWVVPKLAGASLTPMKIILISDEEAEKLKKEAKEKIYLTTISDKEISIYDGLHTIKLSSETGAIIELSVYDINDGKNLVKGENTNLTFAWDDVPKNWPAWNLEHYWNHPISIDHTKDVEIFVEELGPVFITITIKRTILEAPVIQRISLFPNCPEIFFEYDTNWKRPKTLLKVQYSTQTNAEESVADIAYGAIYRKTKPETPADKARFEKIMHKYCDLSTPDNKWGLAIINEGKYAFDTEVDNETIRLTMLRSPDYPKPSGESWANLERKINKEEFNHDVPVYSGIGPFKCRYALLAHKGGALKLEDGKPNPDVKRRAEEFNYPVIIVPVKKIKKDTRVFQLLEVPTHNVFLGTLKLNEWDKNGNIIARFVEGCGVESKAEVNFNSAMVKKIKKIHPVDILERPIDFNYNWNPEKGKLNFDIKPFEIITFEFEL